MKVYVPICMNAMNVRIGTGVPFRTRVLCLLWRAGVLTERPLFGALAQIIESPMLCNSKPILRLCVRPQAGLIIFLRMDEMWFYRQHRTEA